MCDFNSVLGSTASAQQLCAWQFSSSIFGTASRISTCSPSSTSATTAQLQLSSHQRRSRSQQPTFCSLATASLRPGVIGCMMRNYAAATSAAEVPSAAASAASVSACRLYGRCVSARAQERGNTAAARILEIKFVKHQ